MGEWNLIFHKLINSLRSSEIIICPFLQWNSKFTKLRMTTDGVRFSMYIHTFMTNKGVVNRLRTTYEYQMETY